MRIQNGRAHDNQIANAASYLFDLLVMTSDNRTQIPNIFSQGLNRAFNSRPSFFGRHSSLSLAQEYSIAKKDRSILAT